MSDFKLIGTGDIQLMTHAYKVENMKGVIVCVHGMCEHSKRYEDFALYLNQHGYTVYTYDHRGHGESLLKDENKGYLGHDGFNNMVYDLNVVISYVKEKNPNQLVFLLGHSMGSFVTQRYIQMFDTVDGVILSGSNYGTQQLRLGRMLSKLMCVIKGEKKEGKLLDKLTFGGFNKQFNPSRTDFDWLSSEEKNVDLYIEDELCGFSCSNRFYYDFLGGLLELSKKKNMKKINSELPILIISGEEDPVGKNGEGVKKLYQVLSDRVQSVELKLYKGARHEILNEKNNMEVYEDILNWITMIE